VFNWARVLSVVALGAIFGLGALSGGDDLGPLESPTSEISGPFAPDPGTGAAPLGPPPAGELPVSATAEGWISKLAEDYQPILKVARADRFWPVSVSTVLRLRSGGRYTCMSSVKECRTPLALTALTPAGKAEDFLTYPGRPNNAREQFEATLESLGIVSPVAAKWITDVTADPYKSAQIYFFRSDTNPKTKRKLPPGLINLQYWFFYPFNYLPLLVNPVLWTVDPDKATSANVGYHEGDFERISVLVERVNRPGRDRHVPKYVYMAQHKGGKLYDYWDQDQIKLDGAHPIVHVGIGGHASYPNCGAQHRGGLTIGKAYLGLQDHAVCDDRSDTETGSPRGAVFTFGSNTPVVELERDSWACWPGRFGRVKKKGPFGIPLPRNVVDGPETPLRQFENKDECPPPSSS
jgi:Vacuolar protein sorting-associated protein 62